VPVSTCTIRIEYLTHVNFKEVESILTVYTLEDILVYNELTEEDVLYFLIEEEFLELPEIKPIDLE
jgi:hypothetical protein